MKKSIFMLKLAFSLIGQTRIQPNLTKEKYTTSYTRKRKKKKLTYSSPIQAAPLFDSGSAPGVLFSIIFFFYVKQFHGINLFFHVNPSNAPLFLFNRFMLCPVKPMHLSILYGCIKSNKTVGWWL